MKIESIQVGKVTLQGSMFEVQYIVKPTKVKDMMAGDDKK